MKSCKWLYFVKTKILAYSGSTLVTRLEVREALAALSVGLWDISVSALWSTPYEVSNCAGTTMAFSVRPLMSYCPMVIDEQCIGLNHPLSVYIVRVAYKASITLENMI